MRNPNKPIGNRTRNLPVCSVVPQPTALPSTRDVLLNRFKYIVRIVFFYVTLLKAVPQPLWYP
jgi:hypothetical protein